MTPIFKRDTKLYAIRVELSLIVKIRHSNAGAREPTAMLRTLIYAFGLVLVATCIDPQAATLTPPIPPTVLIPSPAHATESTVQTAVSAPEKPTADAQRALLKRYCVSCHNPKLKTGSL